jgi:hypothetical protein
VHFGNRESTGLGMLSSPVNHLVRLLLRAHSVIRMNDKQAPDSGFRSRHGAQSNRQDGKLALVKSGPYSGGLFSGERFAGNCFQW